MTGRSRSLLDLLGFRGNTARRMEDQLRKRGHVRAVDAGGSSAALLASAMIAAGRRKLLFVTPSGRELEHRAAELRTMLGLMGLGGVAVATLPEPARSPEDELPIHPRISVARAESAARLHGEGAAAVVVAAGALRWGIVAAGRFESMCVDISPGARLDRGELAEKLVRIGYVRRQLVTEPGEFALRGYVVDVFSPDRGFPIRAELIGDSVEALRLFDPSDQRSLAESKSYRAVPLRSLPLEKDEEAELRALLAAGRGDEDERNEGRLEMIRRGEEGPWLWAEKAAVAACASLGEVPPDDGAVLLAGREQIEAALEAQRDSWTDLPISMPGNPLDDLRGRAVVELVELAVDGGGDEQVALGLATPPPPDRTADRYGRFLEEVDRLGGEGKPLSALVVMQSERHARRLADALLERGVRAMIAPDPLSLPDDVVAALAAKSEGTVVVTTGSLSSGLVVTEAGLRIFCHAEVYGAPAPPRRGRAGKADAFMSPLEELKPGDYVVHIDHGIGRYDGLHTIRRGDEVLDVVRLLYRDGDRLLLPVDKLTLLQKYTRIEGPDGEGLGVGPRLDKLGGTSWEKVKRRVGRSIRRMAGELLNLYAMRSTIRGISHPPDDELMADFERSFPYPETPDQLRAMEEIKADMERPQPMDRLLCGDVGFGKTELAMRAAVKAATGGRQTVMLAPTTVLAQQHYETFKARLEGGGFPFTVELLSRFRSPAQQRETLERLRTGKADIVIGTHRLLSRDVQFRDLGLLIIDEEQRFGVAHKERIKQLRRKVDVLSMTATPIPRTLNMSLMGIRDISVIETPPRDRLAIQTEVMTFNPERLRQAIEAELARDGQVFYIHNRIERIEHVASMLSRLVPGCRVAVAHARMPSAQLERTMSAFVAREYDLLVSTAIIENGLDIPRANTMIVDRADRFGLAQLYQLRGRVGRSGRPAFAYLLVPSPHSLTTVSRRRLEAIREFSDLGSGFRVAAMDLEIRGAGSLLGGEQSGHIEAVGFDLYNRLLEKAVRDLRGLAGDEEEDGFKTTMNLKLDLHIPESYVDNAGGRLRVYRQVASARAEDELEALEGELGDLYGPPPQSVKALLRFTALKMKASAMKLERIDRDGKQLALKFTKDSEVDAGALAELVASRPGAHFTSGGVLFWPLDDGAPEAVLEQVAKLLHSLGG